MKRIAKWGCLIPLSLIVLVAIVAQCTVPTPVADPPPPAPLQDTQTEEVLLPTVTPQPVDTPTTEPTATTVVAAAQDMGESEIAYAKAAQVIMETSADAFRVISEQFTAGAEDPLLIFDQEWRLEVDIAIATVLMTNGQIRDLVAPPMFADVHDDLLGIASHTDTAMRLLTEALDELNADKIEQAFAEMEEAVAIQDRAIAKLHAMLDTQ